MDVASYSDLCYSYSYMCFSVPTWSGAQPRPKKGHKPSSNGCGATMVKVHLNIHTLESTNTHMHMHMDRRTCMHTNTHTCTHTVTYTRTHTHTHTKTHVSCSRWTSVTSHTCTSAVTSTTSATTHATTRRPNVTVISRAAWPKAARRSSQVSVRSAAVLQASCTPALLCLGVSSTSSHRSKHVTAATCQGRVADWTGTSSTIAHLSTGLNLQVLYTLCAVTRVSSLIYMQL